MAHLDDSLEAVDSRSFDTLGDAAAALADNLDGTLTDEGGELIEENLDDEPEGEEPDGGQENPDDDGDEPESEEEEGEDDEPQAVIEAPASLTAEEKEVFAQLPPEAQQFAKNFASRRDQDVHNGLEKARTAQQAAQQQAAVSLAEAKQASAQEFMTLANAYAPQMPNPANFGTDMEYNQARFEYDQRTAQHDQIVQHAQALSEQANGEIQQAEEQALQSEWAAVIDDLPEARDPAKWNELKMALTPVALELGYSEETIAQAGPTDMRAMKRAQEKFAKADKWDALQSKKMKSVRAGKTAKAGAAQPRGSGKRKAVNSSRQRLRQTGDVRDAAALIQQLE